MDCLFVRETVADELDLQLKKITVVLHDTKRCYHKIMYETD